MIILHSKSEQIFNTIDMMLLANSSKKNGPIIKLARNLFENQLFEFVWTNFNTFIGKEA